MDALLFAKILSDKGLFDLKKMEHKYSADVVSDMLYLLKQTMYQALPLKDFTGEGLVYLENILQLKASAYQALFSGRYAAGNYGLQAMENEIHSTLIIENIRSSRESIRRILGGYAPENELENRIYGMKKGLDFISDKANKITEENIHKLYEMAVGNFLDENDKLAAGNFYRHDSVFIMSSKMEHQGLDYKKLPTYMAQLTEFICAPSKMNALLKAAAIHFYFAYLHPYFDGNGRMARLMHMWYLVQQGYSSAMFIPFSSYINKTKKGYYDAYTQVEENYRISRIIDITPFILYFVENVYNQMGGAPNQSDTLDRYQAALAGGKVTEKERDLFNFVLSAYGENEFSTKLLERDYGKAAYATIRSFVLKFAELSIFSSQAYGNRIKYRIRP